MKVTVEIKKLNDTGLALGYFDFAQYRYPSQRAFIDSGSYIVKAKELDKKFDADEDLFSIMDIGKARRPLRMSNVLKELHTDKSHKVSSK